MPHPPASGLTRSFAPLRAITALALREMATRYGRSPGGYLWALLEPLGAIVILSIGFSLVIHVPPIGNSFILFFATGFLPFSLYNNVSATVGRAIEFSRALLFYPAVTWVDATLARFLLNTLTDVLVMLILFAGLIIVSDIRVLLDFGPVVLATGLAALLALGIGLINCALFGLFPVWMQVWSIINRPLFLLSGIFFLFDDMPEPVRNILWFNPLIHITGLMRTGFFPTYRPDYISVPFVLIVSLTCLFFGALLMGRFHRTILTR